ESAAGAWESAAGAWESAAGAGTGAAAFSAWASTRTAHPAVAAATQRTRHQHWNFQRDLMGRLSSRWGVLRASNRMPPGFGRLHRPPRPSGLAKRAATV